MALIEARHLAKTYYGTGVETKALRDATFTIDAGEFVAIMGPSGSGKSTLLHILGFLDPQTSGTYHFEGKTLDDYGREAAAHIRNKKMGFVFQTFNLLPRTSVLDNVKLPLIYSGSNEREWDERARQAIESVGLLHRLNHDPSELSGGERQRVAIARALVNHPDVIFADEPTGNLDSESGQMVMDIIKELNDKHGHTIILITHETYTAEHAKRIITIKDGEVESDEKVNHRRIGNHSFKK